MSRRIGPADSPWLDVSETARYTRTSRITVLRAIRAGKLKATRINEGRRTVNGVESVVGVYRVHRSWADTWLGLGDERTTARKVGA